MKQFILITCFCITIFVFHPISAGAQDTFPVTIQGSLKDAGVPANGSYDIKCSFFWVPESGALVAGYTFTSVQVTNGVFSVTLPSPNILFNNPLTAIWAEYSVRPAGAPVAYTILSPRQRVSFAPLALISFDSANLGGSPPSQFVQTNDPRLSDPRNPTAGSTNYIQNTNVAQATANFNIGGNGTVGGTFSASTLVVAGNVTAASLGVAGPVSATNVNVSQTSGYSIGGVTAMAMYEGNTVTGIGAGSSNSGVENSFYGLSAGRQSFVGSRNSFFGSGAGYLNESGNDNSYFGQLAETIVKAVAIRFSDSEPG
jgi:hypothetical protein